MRVPPRVAPYQVVVVPMLRDTDEDAAIVDYCADLVGQLNALDVFREPVRALLDRRAAKAATKRWGWVKKGFLKQAGANENHCHPEPARPCSVGPSAEGDRAPGPGVFPGEVKCWSRRLAYGSFAWRPVLRPIHLLHIP